MKRAFLVTTSTVLGVAAVLSYQPGSQTTQALMELTGAAEPLTASTPDVTAPESTPTTAAPTTAAAATPSATASTTPSATAKPKTTATAKPQTTATPAPTKTATATPTPTKTATATPAPTKAATGPRTLTGDAFPAMHGRESYGDVVATVTLDGNTMTNLTLSQSRGGKNDRYIAAVRQYLLPAILQAQDVNVGYVSGATATSEAFIQSLQAALAKK